jgi:hypothetical protein
MKLNFDILHSSRRNYGKNESKVSFLNIEYQIVFYNIILIILKIIYILL